MMHPPTEDDLDEQALDHLAAYHDHLLAGDAASSFPAGGNLGAMGECLRRLEKDRRHHAATAEVVRPVVGRRIGRFELTRMLGQGSYGIVFLAHDPVLRRDVALKLPRLEVLFSSEHRRRFLREAQAAARLQHPNIVSVYEAGEAGGVCYIASAYCRGATLAAWLKQQASLIAPHMAARLLAELADAMHHAHGQGVLHRDLKPSNILLEPRANGDAALPLPRITDFGLAKLLEQEEESTRSGAILGTPCYMAPEQVEGRTETVGPTTDVYALGAVLYEVLTDRPPFKGTTLADTFEQVRNREPLPPSRLHGKLPRDLETICLKCLRKEPGQRYASAGDLAADLRRSMAGEPIHARRAGAISRFKLWCRRPERVPQAGLLLLIFGVASFIWLRITDALILLEFLPIDKPAEFFLVDGLVSTLIYLPAIGLGWRVLRTHEALPMWGGMVISIGFLAATLSILFINVDYDLGGIYKNRSSVIHSHVLAVLVISVQITALAIGLYSHRSNRSRPGC